MNTSLIRNWNSRVKSEDTVFHLGDFCCKGPERGIPGDLTHAITWESFLNGRIIHITGNHDANNTVKVSLNYATITFSKRLWFMSHRPPWQLAHVPLADVYLCGHVHEKWHTETWNGAPVINVGVDANRFMPLTKAELVTIVERFKR